MTHLEVLDSAIKIGLGAAITAVSAWLTLRASHRHDFKKELFRRRLEKLEGIVSAVQAHYEVFVAMWAEYRGQYAIRERDRRPLPTAEEISDFRATAKSVSTTASALHNSEGIAHLLEAPRIAEKIEKYRVAFAEFQMQFMNPLRWPAPDAVVAKAEAVRDMKDDLLHALADEFKKA